MKIIKRQKVRFLLGINNLIVKILSIFGISVGLYGCVAYGPPDDYEQIRKLKDLEKEVSILESQVIDTRMANLKLKVDKENRSKKLKNYEVEKDSIRILLKEFDK